MLLSAQPAESLEGEEEEGTWVLASALPLAVSGNVGKAVTPGFSFPNQ